jgi:hypothetical protein
MPELVKHVDKQAANVRAVIILVRHNEDSPISQRPNVLVPDDWIPIQESS